MKQLLRSLLLLSLLGILLAPLALAQEYRPAGTFYLKPRVGVALYGGDRDLNEENSIRKAFEDAGWGIGIEPGYRFTPAFTLGLWYLAAKYPLINGYFPNDPGLEPIDPENSSEWRHQVGLVGSLYLFPRYRLSPYLLLGGAAVIGKINGSYEVGYGPIGALGLDLALTERTGLFLEFNGIFTFPDDAVDGSTSPVSGGGDTSYDALMLLGGGLRFNLTSPKPPEIVALSCPGECVIANEPAAFSATVDAGDGPVEYTWDFGDGTIATGLTPTHRYVAPGRYEVTFTASNRAGTRTRTCQILVDQIEITSLTASPLRLNVCEPLRPVQFNANVRSGQNVTYAWDFGDGTTASGLNPSHTFRTPGTYTVTLTVSGPCGSDRQTIIVEVDRCDIPPREIVELNTVAFGTGSKKGGPRNSSVLTPAAQELLRANLEVLKEVPNTCVLVEGYAGPGERNPQQLSEQRARSVERFYIDNGLAASRILAVGRGRLDRTEQYQRADSTPVPCAELQSRINR